MFDFSTLATTGFQSQAELLLDLRECVAGRVLRGRVAHRLLFQLRVAFDHQGLEPVWLAERDQTAERAFAVGCGGADQQPRRGRPIGGGRPRVEPRLMVDRAIPVAR